MASAVKIKTNDDKIYSIDSKVASQFGLVSQLVKDLENVEVIPLDQVNGSTFEISIQYFDYSVRVCKLSQG